MAKLDSVNKFMVVKNMEQACPQPLCRSIFKNGSSETSTKIITDTWVNMINQIENNKPTNDKITDASNS